MSDDEPSDLLLTPAELAMRLKVSERHVSRHAGITIPARKVLGKIRFYWPEVLASLPAAAAPAVSVAVSMPTAPSLDFVTRMKRRLKASKGC